MPKTETVQDAQVVESPVKAPVAAPLGAPAVDAGQAVDQDAYVPTYTVKPEFKQAILQAIGDAPFNQIAGIINAVNVETMDHNTLTQVVNVLGNFPFVKVSELLSNVNQYVDQVIEDDDE